MKKLVVTQNITVDGAIEMLGDWFDPQAADEDLIAESQRQDAEADALLVGRKTFEDFRGYWPNQSDDATGVTAYLNRVAKYVVSSTMTDPEWENSTVLAGDPVEQTQKLKSQPGADIVLTGSISLAHTLIAAGWSTSTGCSSTRRCRTAIVPRRRHHSKTGVGRTAQGLLVGYHAAALRHAVIAPIRARDVELDGTMTCGHRRPRCRKALGR
jgi:dihydrofolate reductase